MLLPDQDGPHPHLMVGGCKSGILYVVDRDNLGGMAETDNVVQEISESAVGFSPRLLTITATSITPRWAARWNNAR